LGAFLGCFFSALLYLLYFFTFCFIFFGGSVRPRRENRDAWRKSDGERKRRKRKSDELREERENERGEERRKILTGEREQREGKDQQKFIYTALHMCIYILFRIERRKYIVCSMNELKINYKG
jgi:hypothetical protein